MLTNIQVGAIPSTTLADGAQPPPLSGKFGEQLTGDLVGKYYNLSYRGLVFIGSTALAGTTIPINALNLVSTFTLWNPAGSGKLLKVISYDVGLTTGTTVIAQLALVYQAGIGSTIVIPTSQTALTPVNALVGAGFSSAAKLLSAGTLTGTPSVLGAIGISFGTTAGAAGPVTAHRDFDGTLIVPPGVLITVVSTAAQTAAMQQQFIWAELPT